MSLRHNKLSRKHNNRPLVHMLPPLGFLARHSFEAGHLFRMARNLLRRDHRELPAIHPWVWLELLDSHPR